MRFGLFVTLLLFTGLSGCSHSEKASLTDNPLLQEWTGPHQGLPPFDQIRSKHFQPALEFGMQEALKKYDQIANNSEPATFENTILPMEQASLEFGRLRSLYSIWVGSLSDDTMKKTEGILAPKMADFYSQINQNNKLFGRINQLYLQRKQGNYSDEQQRLIWDYYQSFVKRGAALNENQKKRVAEINKRHSQLTTQFRQNMRADSEETYLHITNKKDLAGLSNSLIESARAAAKSRDLNGWVIVNSRSAMQPFVTHSANRELREKAFKIWMARGDNGNKNDNNEIITEILQLRAERSKIKGFKTYAHWQLSDRMAKTPERAMQLMMRVWKPAIAQVKKDVAAMQKIVDREKGGFKIQPWDYRYYAEKLRKERYDFDMNQLQPYLRLSNIQKAMFWMAKKLYGFEFVRLKEAPIFHPDVTVYTVLKNKKVIGLWYFDPYGRPGKRSGAWMASYRAQHRMYGKNVLPMVSNNSNFVKNTSGEETTISWDNALTMFHEFGHALHGLSSNVTYPSLSGTSTATDFVEFPSQVHEMWLSTPQILKFLVDKSGKRLPKRLISKLKRSEKFNTAFGTTQYLASALIDMNLHLTNKSINPKTFEKEILNNLKLPKETIMRHRMPHFSHIFSGEWYAAGYYSYLWSDVLSQDAYGAFREASGPFDRRVAKKFQKHILSVGNTIDPAETYRNFRGRNPKVEALLKSRGFL